jgi:FkbM family methyltransferase
MAWSGRGSPVLTWRILLCDYAGLLVSPFNHDYTDVNQNRALLMSLLSRPIHKILEGAGYWVRKRSVLPFGIDYQHDIYRMTEMLGIAIKTFFDVGAHIGETAAQALNNFPQARVFSFEPHPSTFAILSSTIRDGRFEAFNLAISDEVGRVPFYDYGTLATSNSMVVHSQFAVRGKHPAKTLHVDATTIDEFCQQHSIESIDVLKIDIEGHELAALRGARRLLELGNPMFIYAEFNTILPRATASGGALAPLGALLEPMGFRFVSTYPEYMITTGELFVTSNVLFVRPRDCSAAVELGKEVLPTLSR